MGGSHRREGGRVRRLAMVGTAVVVGTAASAGAAHAAAIAITPAKACYLSGEKITLTGNGYTPWYAVEVALDGTSLGQLARGPGGEHRCADHAGQDARGQVARADGGRHHQRRQRGDRLVPRHHVPGDREAPEHARGPQADGARLRLHGDGERLHARARPRRLQGRQAASRARRGRAGRSACAGTSCGRAPAPASYRVQFDGGQAVLQADAPARARHDDGVPAP